MTDELDPIERRLARQLADFAETPFPARESLDHVVARAAADGRARTSRFRFGTVLASAAAIAIAIAGVSRFALVAPAATPSPTITPEATTQVFGMLHLTSDPEYDPRAPLTLRYVLADGRILAESDSVEGKTTIGIDRSLPAGPVRLLANDVACTGTIAIEANREVDAVVRILDDPCSVAVVASHAIGAIAHPEPRTAIGAFVVVDSVLVVAPLDPGNTMEPIRRPSDEHAEVLDFDVPPGRYQLALEVDGVVQAKIEVDLERGQAFFFNLRILPSDVPRDCGSTPVEQCEAAIAGAYAGGLFPTPAAARIASVRVRPADTSGCYEPPVFDVFFEVRDEPRTFEVTVGRVPDGRYLVCTY